jgi:hypothetical protein
MAAAAVVVAYQLLAFSGVLVLSLVSVAAINSIPELCLCCLYMSVNPGMLTYPSCNSAQHVWCFFWTLAGRAAQQMQELLRDLSVISTTIHRGLGYGYGREKKAAGKGADDSDDEFSTVDADDDDSDDDVANNDDVTSDDDDDSDDTDGDQERDSSSSSSSSSNSSAASRQSADDDDEDDDELDLRKHCMYGKHRKLPHKKLLVDECSMMALPLAAALVNAVR